MVNLVEIVQIDPLRTVKNDGLGCTLFRRSAVFHLIVFWIIPELIVLSWISSETKFC